MANGHDDRQARPGEGPGGAATGGRPGGAAPRGEGVPADAGHPGHPGHAGHVGGRERYGGMKPGAAFFGWLVTVGVVVILTAIAGAIGLGAVDPTQLQSSPGTAGIVSAIVVLVLLAIAYFAGGYVAGRMARFNGLKQGGAVWVISIVIALLLGIVGTIAGAQYDVTSQLKLPALPVSGSSLTAGGLIALLVLLLVTLGAAMLGGKTGTNYHRKIDRAAGV